MAISIHNTNQKPILIQYEARDTSVLPASANHDSIETKFGKAKPGERK